jgi:hypothetical protein
LSDFPYNTIGKSLFEEGVAAGKHILARNATKKIIFISQLGYGKIYYWSQKRYDGICAALKGFAEPECRMEAESEELPDWSPGMLSPK